MFKSYEVTYYNSDVCYNSSRYKVKIIDDDFEESIISDYISAPIAYCRSVAIVNVLIKIYHQKFLPVAPNLTLLISEIKKRDFMNFSLEYCDKYISEFKLYKEEIEKLLLFG